MTCPGVAWYDVLCYDMLQGMLAIGAALLGSPAVLGVDVDADALEVAQSNCVQYEDPLPVSCGSGAAASLKC
jgi:methylase of polypeptide subunit release factors